MFRHRVFLCNSYAIVGKLLFTARFRMWYLNPQFAVLIAKLSSRDQRFLFSNNFQKVPRYASAFPHCDINTFNG